jgi:hypothetical protein
LSPGFNRLNFMCGMHLSHFVFCVLYLIICTLEHVLRPRNSLRERNSLGFKSEGESLFFLRDLVQTAGAIQYCNCVPFQPLLILQVACSKLSRSSAPALHCSPRSPTRADPPGVCIRVNMETKAFEPRL